MKNSIKAVIFDLDGTLLNTLDDLHASVIEAIRAFSFPEQTKNATRLAIGDGIGNLIARSIPSGKDNTHFTECLEIFRKHYALHNADKTAPYPDILALLEKLRQKGIVIGVVSNKIDSAVKTLCATYFENLIDCAIGEREGVLRKPAPDSLFTCLDTLGIAKENALYVGDSEQDVLTAQNADLSMIAVTWGYRDKDTLAAAGATHFATTPLEILTYME